MTVGINFIDWSPPVGGTNGSFVVGGGTTLTSASGTPAVGSTGFIVDLNPGNPLPVSNFMTFASVPGLAFDLSTVGPGSANTNCAGLAVGRSCSIFAGSPIILIFTGNGTAVVLSAAGIARDGTTNSNWAGNFTTQITGTTPQGIQSLFGCAPASRELPARTLLQRYRALTPASLWLQQRAFRNLQAYPFWVLVCSVWPSTDGNADNLS